MAEIRSKIDGIILDELLRKFSLRVSNDKLQVIKGIAYANEAESDMLAVALSVKDIRNTKAKVVLTEPHIISTDKNLLYCSYGQIYRIMVKISEYMVERGVYPDYRMPVKYQHFAHGFMTGQNVTIGSGTLIEPFTTIGDNVCIGQDCRIGSNVTISSGSYIGDHVIIHAGTQIGADALFHYIENDRQQIFSGIGRCYIDDEVQIGYNTIVQRGTISDTIIMQGTVIGNLVEISHDVKIGINSLIVSQVGICGNVEIGDNVVVMGQSGINNYVHIADDVTVLAKSGVTKNVSKGQIVSGMYSMPHRRHLKLRARLRRIIKEE